MFRKLFGPTVSFLNVFSGILISCINVRLHVHCPITTLQISIRAKYNNGPITFKEIEIVMIKSELHAYVL